MSELEQQEETANPYNMRKPWHSSEADVVNEGADTLFFEENPQHNRSATPKKARKQKVEEVSSEEAVNYKKRYDDLKRHYDDKVAQFKQQEQELRAEIQSKAPQYQPPKSLEELENFKQQYPDLYDTVETVAHVRTQGEMEALRAKLEAIEAREKEISRREAESKLKERHPDFEDIRGSEEFHAWAESQPTDIQRWIYNNPDNVSLASRAIDLYKLERGLDSKKQTKSKPAKQSAADFVSTKTTGVDAKQPKVWTKKEIAALSLDDYEKFESEIDQAIMEGRVVG